MFHGYAAFEAGAPLRPHRWEPSPLADHDVEIEVMHCGICFSDVSMIDNAWRMSRFPLVPGHEVTGRVAARGAAVAHLDVGQVVGVGWNSGSCDVCPTCLGGHHHRCDDGEDTIIGRPGGFAERVRVRATWAIPLPDGLDPADAGPLFCGGVTVFTPFRDLALSPLARVGVVGIGGLGHLALQLARAWGCEVTAFSSTASKADEARRLGAHRVVDSRSAEALRGERGRHDLILSTVHSDLDWPAYLAALAPGGRLHLVGAAPSPLSVPAFTLIGGDRSVSGSGVGSPRALHDLLAFAARHGIRPVTEHFPMDRVNDALDHLRSGRARYRVILDA